MMGDHDHAKSASLSVVHAETHTNHGTERTNYYGVWFTEEDVASSQC